MYSEVTVCHNVMSAASCAPSQHRLRIPTCSQKFVNYCRIRIRVVTVFPIQAAQRRRHYWVQSKAASHCRTFTAINENGACSQKLWWAGFQCPVSAMAWDNRHAHTLHSAANPCLQIALSRCCIWPLYCDLEVFREVPSQSCFKTTAGLYW